MVAKYDSFKNRLIEQPLDNKGSPITFWGGQPNRIIIPDSNLSLMEGVLYEEGRDFVVVSKDGKLFAGLVSSGE